MAFHLVPVLACDLAAKRRGTAALGLDLCVRLLVHLDRLWMVVPFVTLDLLPHDSNVLVDFRCDTIDASLRERNTGTVCREVGRAAWGTLQSATGDLS